MTTAVIGATGRVGSEIVRSALARGDVRQRDHTGFRHGVPARV